MRLLQASLFALTLLTTVHALPPMRGRPSTMKPLFIGPPTRQQRINEGWIDDAAKYFHEQSGMTDELRHYDRRFYNKTLPIEQRAVVLKNLVRSYLTFFAAEGLETWIAHGTLLGWFWNGRILPWDYDIDTQVSGATLRILAEKYNGTIHEHDIPLDELTILRKGRDENMSSKRTYLLDVNPNAVERVRGDGMNVIDARWIDRSSGLYIDITGLSETDAATEPGVVKCKNLHRYAEEDLYPMRESTFEDVPAKIPYAYDKILIAEYAQKALTLTEYSG
jgi:hypothetical protein